MSHRAIMSTIVAMVVYVESLGLKIGPGDTFCSYLPLAHIFDRCVLSFFHASLDAAAAYIGPSFLPCFSPFSNSGFTHPNTTHPFPSFYIINTGNICRTTEEYMLYLGASIGYWQGDIKLLVDDIAACQPTLFCGVPRVFDRIYAGVISAVQGGSFLKRTLFNWGYSRKLHNLNQGYSYDQAAPMFDKIVFSKVKARLGGKVKLIVSGGAPLARHVEDFLRVCMCCRVVQGYGLTETCAGSFIANPDAPEHFGTVGPVLPVLSMRLDAVPEMNYDPNAVPPRGEVCVRGPAVFTGYYKDDEKTKEVLESDGWFHTGDIGELTPSGALKIIDRKKNIFKLAQGEYIAVEKVEGVYKKNTGVEQIWVYGDSFKSALVAVVVPTEGHLKAVAKEAGVATDGSSSAELCANPAVVKAFLADLTATAKEGKLKGFEIARALHLTMDQFTVENDLLTPSYKLKRPQLQKKYQPQIDTMYNVLG